MYSNSDKGQDEYSTKISNTGSDRTNATIQPRFTDTGKNKTDFATLNLILDSFSLDKKKKGQEKTNNAIKCQIEYKTLSDTQTPAGPVPYTGQIWLNQNR